MSETEIRCDYCGRACTRAEQASGWCDHCRSRPIQAGSVVSLNSQFAEAEAAARQMLARDGIRFEEQQPAMETYQVTGTDQYGQRTSFVVHVPPPVPPLYFWLGKDADWPVVERVTPVRDYNYKHIAVGICSKHGHYQSDGGCPGCAQQDWRDEPEFQRLRQAWYAIECEDKRLIAEKAVRIAELEADNARLRAELPRLANPPGPVDPTELANADFVRQFPVFAAARLTDLEAENAQLRADRAFKAGFMAATKYTTGHLSDEQVALVQDAEWDSYAGRIQTPSAQP